MNDFTKYDEAELYYDFTEVFKCNVDTCKSICVYKNEKNGIIPELYTDRKILVCKNYVASNEEFREV